MSILKTCIKEKGYRFRQNCDFVEQMFLDYIDELEYCGTILSYSDTEFSAFLYYYASEEALCSVVSAEECRDILSVMYGVNVDLPEEDEDIGPLEDDYVPF